MKNISLTSRMQQQVSAESVAVIHQGEARHYTPPAVRNRLAVLYDGV